MSRLFGRSYDVYGVSKHLEKCLFPVYFGDENKTTWESVVEAPSKIELYLPQKTIDYINNTPIKLCRSFFTREVLMFFPPNGKEATLCFPPGKAKEEYKRDAIFFTGRLLANHSKDYLPKQNDIACSCNDVLPLLLEYLYLREIGKEKDFFNKYSRDLVENAEKFIKVFDRYEAFEDRKKASDIFGISDRLERMEKSNEKAILAKTLSNVVPLSSMDATLQIEDEYENPEEIKTVIEELFDNPEHNR